MKLDITKAYADSLRAFTQNNYGIQLKPTHAHEIVAAYLGYASHAALCTDKKCAISNLKHAEIIVLIAPKRSVDERIKNLKDFPSGLPSSEILAEGVYAPIISNEQFFGKYGQTFMSWRWIWLMNAHLKI